MYDAEYYVVIENADGQQIRGQIACYTGEGEGEGEGEGYDPCENNLFNDGSFESGIQNAFWTQQSVNFPELICDLVHCPIAAGAHTGEFFVYYYGYDRPDQAYVEQMVNMPAANGATLSFRFQIGRGSGNGTDAFKVLADGTEIWSVTENDTNYLGEYKEILLDVGNFANGSSHTFRFLGNLAAAPSGSNSIFYLDDVCLTAQGILPMADFTALPLSGQAPLHVQFTDASKPGSSSITAWAWNFGDGGSSTQQNPTHTYAAPGSYTVGLTVTTSLGSNTKTKESYITVTSGGEGEG
ncbi:MAG TPA: PKD domain-containing protein, partial [Candidatus Hydrogenedentes bacterium]|nr:PKD domain-containing protein [Candidatus Hydrogenedentota bacterium]